MKTILLTSAIWLCVAGIDTSAEHVAERANQRHVPIEKDRPDILGGK